MGRKSDVWEKFLRDYAPSQINFSLGAPGTTVFTLSMVRAEETKLVEGYSYSYYYHLFHIFSFHSPVKATEALLDFFGFAIQCVFSENLSADEALERTRKYLIDKGLSFTSIFSD